MSEFERIRKSIDGKSGLESPRRRPGLEQIARHPFLASASSVAEIEPRDGGLAELILALHPNIRYTGIFKEAVSAKISSAISALGPHAKAVRGGAEGELPLEPKSQELLLTSYALENMRMSHLYMACSEARRVLRTGGHWIILARDPGRNSWERLASYLKAKAGSPSLNVAHYISPEDWHTEEDSFLNGLNRLLILRRMSDLDPQPFA